MTQKTKYYDGNLVNYEIYKLVDFYDPILRQPTLPVPLETTQDMIRAEYLMHSLSETMTVYGGLGLSANQVGLRDRVCVINLGQQIWAMFNPEIIEKSLTPTQYSEGCLSYPGLYLNINRPDKIRVRFQAVGGQFVEQEFTGLTAVCVQHELDHLDGVVYTDLISPIKLDIAKRKVKQTLKRMKRVASASSPAPRPTVELMKPQTQDSPVKTEKELPEKFVYTAG